MIIKMLIALVLFMIVVFITWRLTFIKCGYSSYRARKERDKFFAMYQVSIRWIQSIYQGKKISEYLKKQGWKRIAIYGCAELGKLLYSDLQGTEINVIYGIDKNKNVNFPIRVISVDEIDKNEKPELIIVTSIAYYSNIYEEIKERCDVEIISLEDVVYELVY